MIRRLVILSLFLILCTEAKAQVLSSVTATITDPSSNAYVNGSYVISFVGPPTAKSNGSTFTQSFSGSLNASGAFGPVLLADNNTVSPGGTQWQFTICTYLGSPCFTASVTVTGPSPSLSAALSAFAPAVTQGIPSGIVRGPAAQLFPAFGIFQPALQITANSGQVSPVIQVTDSTGKNLWLLGTSGAMNGVTLTSGTTAPGSCTAPALFFAYPAGTPNFCSGGVFVAFGTSTGATITGTPVAGNLTVFSASNSITNGNLSGDCTTAGTSTITCTKTAGVAFAPSATTDTTNAGNITAGNLNLARLPAGLNAPVSGGLLSATGGSTYAWTNALGLGLPVIGQGSGTVPTTGTVSGNTTKFGTVSGSFTPGNALKSDGGGNIVDSNTLPGTAATAAPVNVVNDAPGAATTPGGTVTLSLGSKIIATTNQFASSAVGALFQFNSGTNPIFRTPILAVGTNQITVVSPWPGTNATVANADGTTTGNPASGNWNMVADSCAQMNASLLNHPGQTFDDAVSGSSLSCLVNPMQALPVRPGGGLRLLGNAQFKIAREWTPPSYFSVIGASRSNFEGGNNSGTDLQPDTTNFPTQNSESVTGSSTASTVAASTTFTDTGAGVTVGPPAVPAFQTSVASAACDGTGFGHLTLTTTANGLTLGGILEGQNLILGGFTNTVWNGSNLMVGTSGPNIEIQFASNNCSAPAQVFPGSTTANTLRSDFLQGSYTGNTTGVSATTSVQTPCLAGTNETNPPFAGGSAGGACIEVTDTLSAGTFLATDANSCTLTATSNFTNAGPYTIAEFIDSNHVNIMTNNGANPVWTTSTLVKTCYFQSTVSRTGTITATTLTTTVPLQSSSIGNVSYSIAPPMMAWQNFGSGAGQTFALYASKIANMSVNCNQMANCNPFQNLNGQEESSFDNMTLGYTNVGLEIEGGHWGPLTNMNISYNSSTNITPLSSCIDIWTNTGTVSRDINSFTCTVGGTILPFASVDVEGNRATIRNGHHEGYVNAYVFCQYTGFQCKGDILEGAEPGIQGYNNILIPNVNNTQGATVGLVILGHFNNNSPQNASIDDHLVGQHCGPGRSLVFNTNAETPLYVLGQVAPSSSLYRYRITTANNVDSCMGTQNSNQGSSTLNAQYFKANSQVIQLVANQTISATALTTIPGMTWTSPAQSAQNWTFDCTIEYSEVATLGPVSFGVQTATTAATMSATGEQQVAAGVAAVPGTPVNNNSSTTFVTTSSGTPGVAATIYTAHTHGTLFATAQPTASVTVFNLGAAITSTDGNATVYGNGGTACTIW